MATPLLAELGELHYGRRKRQPSPKSVRDFYARAEERLLFPLVRFDARQIEQVACSFAEVIADKPYTCYACAIMPDHVHILIRKHRDRAETMINSLQAASRLRLSSTGDVPPNHPVWTQGGRKRFLDSPSAVRTAIRYIEENPTKSVLSRQSWPFVTPYEGWPNRARASR